MATAIQQRLLDLAADIATSPPEDLAFTHSVLAQTSLPTTRPPDGMRRWERHQGRATLLVQAGEAIDPTTQKFIKLPLPYGPKARLLLMHLNTEAVRRQSPIIPVEDSMTAFFRRVMGRTLDGRQIRMLKDQLTSLAAASFSLGIIQGDDRALQVDTKVVTAFNLWLQKDDAQRVLWPSILRLSADYYESLTRFAVLLDERACCTRPQRNRIGYLLLARPKAPSHSSSKTSARAMVRPIRSVRERLPRNSEVPSRLPQATHASQSSISRSPAI